MVFLTFCRIQSSIVLSRPALKLELSQRSNIFDQSTLKYYLIKLENTDSFSCKLSVNARKNTVARVREQRYYDDEIYSENEDDDLNFEEDNFYEDDAIPDDLEPLSDQASDEEIIPYIPESSYKPQKKLKVPEVEVPKVPFNEIIDFEELSQAGEDNISIIQPNQDEIDLLNEALNSRGRNRQKPKKNKFKAMDRNFEKKVYSRKRVNSVNSDSVSSMALEQKRAKRDISQLSKAEIDELYSRMFKTDTPEIEVEPVGLDEIMNLNQVKPVKRRFDAIKSTPKLIRTKKNFIAFKQKTAEKGVLKVSSFDRKNLSKTKS